MKKFLYKKQILKIKFQSLRSHRQQLYQIVQKKIALTALCTYFFPRYGVKLLPFGHVIVLDIIIYRYILFIFCIDIVYARDAK